MKKILLIIIGVLIFASTSWGDGVPCKQPCPWDNGVSGQITTTDNVGIGTATPTVELDVVGVGQFTGGTNSRVTGDEGFIDFGTASGKVSICGVGNTNNECLVVDTETTANAVIFGTSTGVDSLILDDGIDLYFGGSKEKSLSRNSTTLALEIAETFVYNDDNQDHYGVTINDTIGAMDSTSDNYRGINISPNNSGDHSAGNIIGLAFGNITDDAQSTETMVSLIATGWDIDLRRSQTTVTCSSDVCTPTSPAYAYVMVSENAGAADVFTIANGKTGQEIYVMLALDNGDDITVTPTTFLNGTSVTLANVGDAVLLHWTLNTWAIVSLYPSTVVVN